jgi:hypothetical protein
MTADLVARLAQEIRRVDGSHSLGAGALAEALAPFVEREAASALRSIGEAVATVCLVGERYAHGNMVEVQLQLASAYSPAPKIGDRYYLHPATPASAWRPIAEAALLTRNAVGVSGPCAVLLRIDTGRPGPFIRQGRFDAAAGAFVCDSTGQVLRDAIAFVEPEFPTPPTSTKGG